MNHGGRGAAVEVSPSNSFAEALRLESRPPTPQSACDDSFILARKASSDNSRSPAKGGVDGCLTSALLPADYYCSLSKISQSVSSHEVVVVTTAKVLHETQCSSEAPVLFGDASNGAFFASPAKCAMEGLFPFCDDAAAASPPPFPPPRLFLGSENENPRDRREVVVQSFPTPRAPVKPARVRSLNTLFPGKTRRRLDFDHL